jgi:23S rRNA (cytosine1962-C5)-methyltransferase
LTRGDFVKLFSSAIETRLSLFDSSETDCFRLFNSDGDGFEGITADYYSGYILMQYFNAEAEENLKDAVNAASSVYSSIPGGIKGLLVKNRMNISGRDYNEARRSVIIEGIYPEEGITVFQNGIKARADLLNGQSTGVFLDMREIRSLLPEYYAEYKIKSMLNLFCYTGLFSVHALASGIDSAVNVDLAKSVLLKARENYRLNNFSCDDRDFIYGDAIEWIKLFAKKNKLFDFAVFDPPTFARNRKKQFSVKRDYMPSLEFLDKITVNGGLILTSVNSYSVSEKEYRSYHPGSWQLLMFGNESADFVNRGNPYLKAGLWKK